MELLLEGFLFRFSGRFYFRVTGPAAIGSGAYSGTVSKFPALSPHTDDLQGTSSGAEPPSPGSCGPGLMFIWTTPAPLPEA